MSEIAIFKFMTLRGPDNPDYQKDCINFIRDSRIPDVYLPVYNPTIESDNKNGIFDKSSVAKYIFGQVQLYLLNVNCNKDLLLFNQTIAQDVSNYFLLKEKTNAWIEEFAQKIADNLKDFNKPKLIQDLNSIVKKWIPNCNNITDYVTKPAVWRAKDKAYSKNETNKKGKSILPSQFCLDFDELFDQLYVVYVAKRRYPINLEDTMNGLRALHIIRFLIMT